MRAGPLLVGLLLFAPGAARAADPAWVADVVGHYAGKIRNAGQIECHYTDFALQDGHLVGHYRIEDAEPFEGELTDFVPETENAGTFTWTDRYGVGREFVVFAHRPRQLHRRLGRAVHRVQPGWGIRGGIAGCAGAVS